MTILPTRPHRKSYSLQADIDLTISSLFGSVADAEPHIPYIIDDGEVFDRARTARLAGALQDRLMEAGVRPGDVVTVQLPNWAEAIVAMHAIWGLGAVVNPVTPIYRGAELQAIFRSARPRVVLIPGNYRDTDYAAMTTETLTEVSHEAAVIATERNNLNAESDFRDLSGSADDVAILMYTSGTTGHPKGVLHTHRTLLREARSIREILELHAGNVFMPSPLSHVTGLLYGVLMPLDSSSGVVLMDRWEPRSAVELIENYRCEATVSATPFLRGLADAYEQQGRKSSLRTFICGGADIPPSLVARASEVMGTVVSRTYGSTEMPTLCIVHPDDREEDRLATEGHVIGEARARVIDPTADGEGELQVHSPELFVGYLDPTDNQGAFTDDGWFKTGDLARINSEGVISIVGRLKDVIVRGGENISAKEVEDLLVSHPAISDVAVVGVPDDVMGERACAVVVSDDPALRLSDLTRHLSTSGIAKQKYPEAIYLADELPRTASGKIQKYQLRAILLRAIAEGRVEVRS